jgi:hypothetical protein
MLAGAAVGIVMSRQNHVPRGALIGAFAGIAADFDFIPGILMGEPGRFHHAESHSITAAVLVAVVIVLIAKSSRLYWGLLIGLGCASHLVLDLLTFDDSPPHGIPVLWPFLADTFQSPVTLFPSVPWGNSSLLTGHNFDLLVRELVFAGLLFMGALFYMLHRRPILEDVK